MCFSVSEYGEGADLASLLKGEFGGRLKNSISKGEESCFILGEGERCPFLNYIEQIEKERLLKTG